MANQTSKIGRIADLEVNGTKVGYLKGVNTIVRSKIEKSSGYSPSEMFSRKDEFTIEADLMYVDKNYVNLVLGKGENISIVFGPVGSSANNSKEKYNNCEYVGADRIKEEQDGIVGYKVCWKVSSVTDGPEQQRNKVFISYSHQDIKVLNKLLLHLKPLMRDGIEIWYDSNIKTGSKWHEEIEKALRSTKVALLLVSVDFIASDFIQNEELPKLLLAAQDEGATILPLILNPCSFKRTKSLSPFQAFNSPKKPLCMMNTNERAELFEKVADTIADLFRTQKPFP